jgi:ELWxxDGT repeat protein
VESFLPEPEPGDSGRNDHHPDVRPRVGWRAPPPVADDERFCRPGDQYDLFRATSVSGLNDLWVSDTLSGQTIDVPNAPPNGIVNANTTLGLSPTDFATVNGHVIFSGDDTIGQIGLWTTNGTTAGTVRLVATSCAGSVSSVSAKIVIGGEAYFGGVTSTGVAAIWKTDGTAAGTPEISATQQAVGVDIVSLAAFNGKAFFTTDGAAGSLFSTNGASVTSVIPPGSAMPCVERKHVTDSGKHKHCLEQGSNPQEPSRSYGVIC